MRLLCALVAAACPALLGLGRADALRRRPEQLADIMTALELMKNEIGQRRTAMTDLPDVMLENVSGVPRELFLALGALLPLMDAEGFAGIWRRAVSVLPLRRAELAALSRLGSSLGRFDAPAQCSEIDACIARFALFEQEADAERRKNVGVCAGLGLALGLMLAVLII